MEYHTFKEWIDGIDRRAMTISGLSLSELKEGPDPLWFEEGMSIEEATRRVLEHPSNEVMVMVCKGIWEGILKDYLTY
jgi:hypothetical protein